MKRLIFIIAITLAMCMPALGITYSAYDNATFNNAYQWTGGSKDRATIWAQDIESLTEVGGALAPGADGSRRFRGRRLDSGSIPASVATR